VTALATVTIREPEGGQYAYSSLTALQARYQATPSPAR
jgi:hypothetical protein